MTQQEVTDYFANHWSSGSHWSYTNNKNIAAMIWDEDSILDVGCGINPLSKYFKNSPRNDFYAFDPAFPYGDEKCTLEDFDPKDKKWATILCLGSINFGSQEVIEAQIKKIESMLMPGGQIIWRQNPGIADHDNEESKNIDFFPWSFEINHTLAEKFGMDVSRLEKDIHLDNPDKYRIFAIWKKPLVKPGTMDIREIPGYWVPAYRASGVIRATSDTPHIKAVKYIGTPPDESVPSADPNWAGESRNPLLNGKLPPEF
jgi:SAM-dependent methyltransferase